MPPHRIRTILDVASVLQCDARHLRALAARTQTLYAPYRKPKPGGGFREIAPPSQELKDVQAAILTGLFPRILPAPTRWVERDPVSNALRHLGQANVVTLDLRAAFPSTRQERVNVLFRHAGLHPATATLLTRLCTFCGALPQGAPTSNAILDAVLHDLDVAIGTCSDRGGFCYTRYADNFAVSGPRDAEELVQMIVRQASRLRYAIPNNRIYRGGGLTEITVTGVVLSGRTTRASPEAIDKARAALQAADLEPHPSTRDVARGHLNWIQRIDVAAARALRAQFPSVSV